MYLRDHEPLKMKQIAVADSALTQGELGGRGLRGIIGDGRAAVQIRIDNKKRNHP
jgi:hypothetical protein